LIIFPRRVGTENQLQFAGYFFPLVKYNVIDFKNNASFPQKDTAVSSFITHCWNH
jgi:hypothetical protein